jgi:hypothetical protein
VVILGCVFVVAAIVIMHAGRNTTFYFDDWNFVNERLGWRPHVLLYPHNEHLSLLPVLVYKLLFETVGLDNYGVFRFVSVLFNLTSGTLLFIYVRRRLGPWPALGFSSVLVVMGAGAWDIVWPFQIGFLGSMAATLGALLMLDRRSRAGDIAACLLVCVSLSSSSQGLMLLAAVIIEVLVRPDRWRRIWIPAIPLVLYGLWYLKYGAGHLNWETGIPLIPDRIYTGLQAGSSAATGLPDSYGATLALALIAAFIYSLTAARDRLPRLLMVAAMPIAFWALIALARTGLPPTEPRYLYPTGIYIVLLASECFLLFAPRGVAAVAIAVLLGMGALARVPALNSVGDTLRGEALSARSSLTAGEILIDRIGPKTLVAPGQPQLFLHEYEKAAARYGSTVTWTPDQLRHQSAAERGAVDSALIRLIGPFAAPAPSHIRANCKAFPGDKKDRGGPLASRTLLVEAGAQPVEVRLRRFGDGVSEQPQVTVPPNSNASVNLPKDRAPQPWIAAVRSGASFNACQG